MANDEKLSVTRLIAVPAVITLVVTLVRLTGELEHWGMPWFGNKAGGEGAIVGISWLPLIFGPYFAIKLAKSGHGWQSGAGAWGFLGLGVVIVIAGAALGLTFLHGNLAALGIVGFAVMLVAALVVGVGWRELGRTLVAYAFAARVPILVVMFLAMRGNGGAGWGTHYDAVDPDIARLPFAEKYFYTAFLPQMTFWIAWTVIAGTAIGLLAMAITRAGKRPATNPAGS
jgi:hypothetical protein